MCVKDAQQRVPAAGPRFARPANAVWIRCFPETLFARYRVRIPELCKHGGQTTHTPLFPLTQTSKGASFARVSCGDSNCAHRASALLNVRALRALESTQPPRALPLPPHVEQFQRTLKSGQQSSLIHIFKSVTHDIDPLLILFADDVLRDHHLNSHIE